MGENGGCAYCAEFNDQHITTVLGFARNRRPTSSSTRAVPPPMN